MPLAAAPVLASIIGAGGSIVGGALANKSQSSTTPTLDPAYSPLQSQVLSMIKNRLNSSADLSGYQAGGIQNINRVFNNASLATNNDLSARGLSTSPIAATRLGALDLARAGQVSGFENSLPLLQRDLQAQDLGLAGNILSMGRGSTTQAQSGGGPAGAATNLAGYLGYLMGNGAFKRNTGIYTSPTGSYTPSDTNGWG